MRQTKILAYCWPGKDNGAAFDYAKTIDYLAVVGFTLNQAGEVCVPGGFTQLLPVRERGTELLAVLQNLGVQGFDGEMLKKVLESPVSRQALVDNCSNIVKAHSLAGIHLDFENYGGDSALLNHFVRELAEALRPDHSVSMALPAKTAATTWFTAYDYKGLAGICDFVVLMSYDLHWPGGEPGPVAAVPWMEQVVDFALSRGWKKQQLFLGVPLYGYDWPEKGKGKAILHHQAIELLRKYDIESRWHRRHCERYFEYVAGDVPHSVWYQDEQAIRYKASLAHDMRLAGVGIWRLGFHFPGMWKVLR